MKIDTEWTGARQATLTIEAEPEEVENFLQQTYRNLVRSVVIPGFRKGKAPRAMLERYIGKEAFMGEAIEHMVPKLYSDAIDKMKLEAIGEPHLEIVTPSPLVFKATVPLRPLVELGNYREVRVAPEPVELKEEQVDAVIERLRNQHAVWEPASRPIRFGDLAIIHVQAGTEGGTLTEYKAQEYVVLEDSISPVPGFSHQLVGMEKGQEKEFDIPFAADYDKIKDLAGKNYRFRAEVVEVKEKRLPEVNDEFAKGLGKEFDSLATLRERAAANLKQVEEGKARMIFEGKVIDAVVERSKVEFPPLMVERDIDSYLEEQAERWGGGKKGLTTFLTLIGKTEEEFRVENRQTISRNIAHSLVLDKVAEVEKLEVPPAEVDAEIENVLEGAAEKREERKAMFNTLEGRRRIERSLILQRAREFLVKVASDSPLEAAASPSVPAESGDVAGVEGVSKAGEQEVKHE